MYFTWFEGYNIPMYFTWFEGYDIARYFTGSRGIIYLGISQVRGV